MLVAGRRENGIKKIDTTCFALLHTVHIVRIQLSVQAFTVAASRRNCGRDIYGRVEGCCMGRDCFP